MRVGLVHAQKGVLRASTAQLLVMVGIECSAHPVCKRMRHRPVGPPRCPALGTVGGHAGMH